MNNDLSFSSIDELTAESQYNSWASKKYETLDEFILRKRRIELNCLVKRVVENELEENDRQLIRMHWYEDMSFSAIAEKTGFNKSTIKRRLDKINNIIYDKLKYAIEYRYGKDYSDTVNVIVKNRDAVFCIISPSDMATRIKHLRTKQSFTVADVSLMTNISETELEKIEKAQSVPGAGQIAKLATAFKTTTDYLIFGR